MQTAGLAQQREKARRLGQGEKGKDDLVVKALDRVTAEMGLSPGSAQIPQVTFGKLLNLSVPQFLPL